MPRCVHVWLILLPFPLSSHFLPQCRTQQHKLVSHFTVFSIKSWSAVDSKWGAELWNTVITAHMWLNECVWHVVYDHVCAFCMRICVCVCLCECSCYCLVMAICCVVTLWRVGDIWPRLITSEHQKDLSHDCVSFSCFTGSVCTWFDRFSVFMLSWLSYSTCSYAFSIRGKTILIQREEEGYNTLMKWKQKPENITGSRQRVTHILVSPV